jgi:enterochelin esterase-like enzyme
VTQEIMPVISERFGGSHDPARLAFGGGSFGGVAALYAALHYPHVFGAVLAESPSLWAAEGRFLADLSAHRGPLPERLFMACGTREYSGTRDHERWVPLLHLTVVYMYVHALCCTALTYCAAHVL